MSTLFDKLKNINLQNVVDVWVPSAEKTIKFSGLTIKQQKDLFTTGLQGNASTIALQDTITDIILKNTQEPHPFNIFDKLPIILALKVKSLNTNGVVENNGNEQNVDISSILNNKVVYTDKTAVLNFADVCFVEVVVPTIIKDKQVNQSHIEQLKKQQYLENTVGDLYVYEIVKYIKEITVSGEAVDCTKMQPKEVYKLVEALPAELNKQIIEFTQKLNAKQQSYLTINKGKIVFDARLFVVE